MTKFPKPTTRKNKKYIEWIKSLCCCVTGRQSVDPNTGMRYSDPHHVNLPGWGKMSGKTDDYRAIPLCHELHVEAHMLGNLAFQMKHGVDFELLIQLLNEFWEKENGAIEPSEGITLIRRKGNVTTYD